MPMHTYPLALPDELLESLRQCAGETGLSMADTMRQSIKLGMPRLKEQLSAHAVKPLTAEECRECWGEPDPEFDALAAHCASLPVPGTEI
jgi:hypothetical protein